MTAPSSPRWADLGIRSLSAIVLAPLALLADWQGGQWFALFVAVLGLLMAREWVTIVHKNDDRQFAVYSIAVLFSVMLLPQLLGTSQGQWWLALLIGLAVISSTVEKKHIGQWAWVGVIYITLPLLAFMLLRGQGPSGFIAIIWCLITVWAADILAYFAGRIIGGPKLAPQLSPKKTWAGLGGAITGAVLASIAFTLVNSLKVAPLAAIAAMMAVAEQGGDIFESAMKRKFNVKDSGNLIPGHGGVLDRVDGLIAVLVLAAALGYFRNPGDPASGLLIW